MDTNNRSGIVSRSFFFDQIRGAFLQYSTYGHRDRAEQLEALLINAEAPQVNSLASPYVEWLVHTQEMSFTWREDCPQYLRTIEAWWSMVQAGDDPVACYTYFVLNVPNEVWEAYGLAQQAAYRRWKPPEERMDENLTPEEAANPKDG